LQALLKSKLRDPSFECQVETSRAELRHSLHTIGSCGDVCQNQDKPKEFVKIQMTIHIAITNNAAGDVLQYQLINQYVLYFAALG